jgi:hypothetical protein
VHQKLVKAGARAHAGLVGRACAVSVALDDFEAANRRESYHTQHAAKRVALFKAARHFFA